jgi:hypothetical protein
MSIKEFKAQLQTLPTELPLHYYLIADAAQDKQHPSVLLHESLGTRSQCLLTFDQGPDLDAAAPHLMTFPQFDADAESWQWLFGYGPSVPAAFSIIASPLSFDELYVHLHAMTEVVLPDGEEMIFAFWDPAILGTLVGQRDDRTLHVPGPALTTRECGKFLSCVTAWWYWDRDGGMHQIVKDSNAEGGKEVVLPLKLTQTQVDMLVEASVPDHILSYINANRPGILADLPVQERYARVEKHLKEARKLNLRGMRDILDYVCASLIYGDRMIESQEIATLLQKVKSRELSLTQALEQFP